MRSRNLKNYSNKFKENALKQLLLPGSPGLSATAGKIRHIYSGNDLIASIDENDNVVYTHKDHLGSGNVRTNTLGTLVGHLEYFPYGEKRVNTGSSSFIKQRYTGQMDDEESNLYYYNQRYYDSKIGRFVSADGLYAEEIDERGSDSQEVNLYGYVRNNPYKFIDPRCSVNTPFTLL